MTKTTEITVEGSDVFVVRRAKKPVCACCEACGARADVEPEDAARAAGLSTPTIDRRVEAGRVHSRILEGFVARLPQFTYLRGDEAMGNGTWAMGQKQMVFTIGVLCALLLLLPAAAPAQAPAQSP